MGIATWHPTTDRREARPCIGNEDWCHYFPQAQVLNSVAPISDHTPIVLHTTAIQPRISRRSFRFENMWLQEPELDGVLEQSWDAGQGSSLLERLNNCAHALSAWGKKIKDRFRKDINDCNKKLQRLQGLSDNDSMVEFRATQDRLCLLLSQEELYWRQRAKSFWMKDGDRNTKYFHASASMRKRRKKSSGF